MRALNIREKELLRKIVELRNKGEMLQKFSKFLQDDIFTEEKQVAPFIFVQSKQIILYIKLELWEEEATIRNKVGEFLEIVMLIEYLNKNNYLYIFPDYLFEKNTLYIMYNKFDKLVNSIDTNRLVLNEQGYYINSSDASVIHSKEGNVLFKGFSLSAEESNIYELVKNNLMGLHYITEALLDFVDNDFQTIEQRQFREQQYIAWAGIIIALILGLFGLIPTLLNMNKPTSLDAKQFEQIIKLQKDQLKKHLVIEKEIDDVKIKIKNFGKKYPKNN